MRTSQMKIDVYPVGVLADLLSARGYLTGKYGRGQSVAPPPWAWRIRQARYSLRHAQRTIVREIRSRKWRDLKNTFNGYLAEPTPFPDGVTRCGSGWTKARARRSLDQQLRMADARSSVRNQPSNIPGVQQ